MIYDCDVNSRPPGIIQRFGKLIAAGIASQAPLFCASFSSVGPGISDPRLLGYIFDFVSPKQYYTKEEWIESLDYNFCCELWYYSIKWNIKKLSKRGELDNSTLMYYLRHMIPIWKHSPEFFLKMFDEFAEPNNKSDQYNYLLYCILRISPTKETADLFLEKYCGHFNANNMVNVIQDEFQTGELIVVPGFPSYPDNYRRGIISYIGTKPVPCDWSKNTKPVPCDWSKESKIDTNNTSKEQQINIELYVHEKLFNDKKYGIFDEIEKQKNQKDSYPELLNSLCDYVSLHWQRHKNLKELTTIFHIGKGSKIFKLATELLKTGNEDHALFWANLGIKSIGDNLYMWRRYYSVPFWLALRQILLDNPDGPS